MSSGNTIGVYVTQHGPGSRTAWERWRLPMVSPSRCWCFRWATCAATPVVPPHFNSSISLRSFTSPSKPIGVLSARCAGHHAPCLQPTQERAGGPVVVEIPIDRLARVIAPRPSTRPTCVSFGAARCAAEPSSSTHRCAPRATVPIPPRRDALPRCWSPARRPVMYAWQGVHFAEAWPQLRRSRRDAGASSAHEPRRQERFPRKP